MNDIEYRYAVAGAIYVLLHKQEYTEKEIYKAEQSLYRAWHDLIADPVCYQLVDLLPSPRYPWCMPMAKPRSKYYWRLQQFCHLKSGKIQKPSRRIKNRG